MSFYITSRFARSHLSETAYLFCLFFSLADTAHAAFSSRYPPPTHCRNYSSSPTSCARFVSLAAKRLLPRVFVDPADRPLVCLCLCLHPPPPPTTTLLLLLAALSRASRNSVRKLTWKERVRSRLLLLFLSFSAPPAHLPYPLLLPMIRRGQPAAISSVDLVDTLRGNSAGVIPLSPLDRSLYFILLSSDSLCRYFITLAIK